MRSEDLLWAMGDIDEQLIAEADPCAAVSKEGSGDGHKKNETEEELTRQQSEPAGERRDTEKVISPFRAKWMTARMISAAAAVIFNTEIRTKLAYHARNSSRRSGRKSGRRREKEKTRSHWCQVGPIVHGLCL